MAGKTVKALGRYGAIALGVFLLFFLAGFAKDWWDRRNDPAFQKDAATAATGTSAATVIAARTDTVYREGATVYLRGRDVLLNPGPGKAPASSEVKACFALADDLKSKCDTRHDADVALSDSLRKELKVWQDRPAPRVPRVQFYGEAGYDLAQQVPVFGVGGTAKVFGPLHLSVVGQYAAPKAGSSDPAFRALAGIRILF